MWIFLYIPIIAALPGAPGEPGQAKLTGGICASYRFRTNNNNQVIIPTNNLDLAFNQFPPGNGVSICNPGEVGNCGLENTSLPGYTGEYYGICCAGVDFVRTTAITGANNALFPYSYQECENLPNLTPCITNAACRSFVCGFPTGLNTAEHPICCPYGGTASPGLTLLRCNNMTEEGIECTSNANCIASTYCTGGRCRRRKDPWESCTNNVECKNNACGLIVGSANEVRTCCYSGNQANDFCVDRDNGDVCGNAIGVPVNTNCRSGTCFPRLPVVCWRINTPTSVCLNNATITTGSFSLPVCCDTGVVVNNECFNQTDAVQCFTHQHCEHVCASPSGNLPGVCVPGRPLGLTEVCTDSLCQSGWCRFYFNTDQQQTCCDNNDDPVWCRNQLPGSPCITDVDCLVNCTDNVCTAPLLPGNRCAVGKPCASGTCLTGTCPPYPRTQEQGTVCTSNTQCFTNNCVSSAPNQPSRCTRDGPNMDGCQNR